MLIEVDHLTRYTYSNPVRLGTQTVRLKPRTDALQTLRNYEIRIQPASATTDESQDLEGNAVTFVYAAEPVSQFELATRLLVETRAPPEGANAPSPRFPLHYAPDVPAAVLGYRNPVTTDATVNRFAAEVADGARWELLPFLSLLAARIQKTHAYQVRHEGPPYPAAMTLERKEGACRDFAILSIEACRSLGVAARFVSGYRLREADKVGHDLHAWVEAYIPGVGWRGYDPTIGKPVADRHVAVAVGNPMTSAPVTGSFWGSATSTLTATVEVRRVAPEMQGAA